MWNDTHLGMGVKYVHVAYSTDVAIENGEASSNFLEKICTYLVKRC